MGSSGKISFSIFTMTLGEFWWFAVIVSGVVGCTEAIFTAPLPEYLHGLTGYEITGSNGKSSKIIKNEVMRASDENRANEPSSRRDPVVDEEQTVYVIEFESEPREKNHERGSKSMDSDTEDVDNQSPLDPWSIVWYIGSFGGLVAFFLIVSCSEWCCRRSARPLGTPYAPRTAEPVTITRNVTDTPPPPYHLFAPPPYDSVNYNDLVDKTTGEKVDIYVISVPITTTEPTVPA
ncbi:uncharacterized protein LOC135160994 isoform X1 [Diachasmimorpha longicaudata]|uniref:uncharacterized protein LOC135160994 isoform X1 n=1 Tax=Diachasmimorpha longicaudata TaxID=58733 RepID=UPI0030B8EDD9